MFNIAKYMRTINNQFEESLGTLDPHLDEELKWNY